MLNIWCVNLNSGPFVYLDPSCNKYMYCDLIGQSRYTIPHIKPCTVDINPCFAVLWV